MSNAVLITVEVNHIDDPATKERMKATFFKNKQEANSTSWKGDMLKQTHNKGRKDE